MGEPSKSYVDAKAVPPHIAGTWVNSAYGYVKFPPLPQKMVISTNGDLENWGQTDSFNPSYRLRFKIEKCWIEKDGSLYCHAHVTHPVIGLGSSTELWKLDRSGASLETMYRRGIVDEFPKRICARPDPRGPDNYSVYYREWPKLHARTPHEKPYSLTSTPRPLR
jgi:hypothetical protein